MRGSLSLTAWQMGICFGFFMETEVLEGTPLDVTTRLQIAAGAARGLAFLHNSCKSLKLTHVNIKSTNVLIDTTGNAWLSDFGLSGFELPSLAPTANGYRAPEAMTDGQKLTQKSDVYSFVVLLLELLTGKCPSIVDDNGPWTGYTGVVHLPRWVQSVVREEWIAEIFDLELMRYKDIEEEMVGVLQIAVACSSASQINGHREPCSEIDRRVKKCGDVSITRDSCLGF